MAAPDLQSEAQNTAVKFAKLNMPAHRETKMLVREQMLKNVRAAIEADRAVFRALFTVP